MSQQNHVNVNKQKDQNINQKMEGRIVRLEVTIENINASLMRIENKINIFDNDMKIHFDKINSRFWTNFYWMVGANAAILLVMAHGFKWI